MLAIDTNLIVRYVTNDHAEQSPKARGLIDAEPVFVATTVLLETEWVLRSAYRFSGPQIVQALAAFAGLPTVTFQDPLTASRALDAMAAGVDFTDALHLAAAEGCDAFVSFDKRFVSAAETLGGVKARLP